jgi:hypothetical protein
LPALRLDRVVFREALPASWRLGERLTVIDGTRAPLD